MTLPVLIDTDTATGVPDSDPDDGLALVQAFHEPSIDIKCITSVFGNASVEHTDRIAREVMRVVGGEGIPIGRGADSAGTSPTEASELLIEALRQGPATILALGPLTNIAAALVAAPEIAEAIEQIVFVGGRRPGADFTLGHAVVPVRDFNFECDPEAGRIVLAAGRPLTYVGFEVCIHTHISRQDVIDLTQHDTPVTRYLAGPVLAWIDRWKMIFGFDHFVPWDSVAVAYLTNPEWFTTESGRTEIVDVDGMPQLHASPSCSGPPATFAATVEHEPFHARLLELLAA